MNKIIVAIAIILTILLVIDVRFVVLLPMLMCYTCVSSGESAKNAYAGGDGMGQDYMGSSDKISSQESRLMNGIIRDLLSISDDEEYVQQVNGLNVKSVFDFIKECKGIIDSARELCVSGVCRNRLTRAESQLQMLE
jgi:hypothetical protein